MSIALFQKRRIDPFPTEYDGEMKRGKLVEYPSKELRKMMIKKQPQKNFKTNPFENISTLTNKTHLNANNINISNSKNTFLTTNQIENENLKNIPNKNLNLNINSPEKILKLNSELNNSENLTPQNTEDLLRNLPIKERRQHLQKQEKYRKLIPDLEEHLFTSKEVIEIIEKALTKQRRKMTDDFQEYLSFRLSQQFQDFARYNEECIMNSMKQRGEPNYII